MSISYLLWNLIFIWSQIESFDLKTSIVFKIFALSKKTKVILNTKFSPSKTSSYISTKLLSCKLLYIYLLAKKKGLSIMPVREKYWRQSVHLIMSAISRKTLFPFSVVITWLISSFSSIYFSCVKMSGFF